MIKKLSKKHQSLIDSIQAESGLIDDCKYMVYFKGEHSIFGTSYPIKNITELKDIMKDY